nr:zinc finger, CCHC-type [Tanacetum cinerariifolium]
MLFQEAIGRLKTYEERIKKPNKEEDTDDRLLYAKTGDKEDEKEHSCERCGYRKSNQDKGKDREPPSEENEEEDEAAMRKQESIFTSTECANMFKKYIIDSRVKELGNAKLNNKLNQLKKVGIGSKLLERMRWEGGVLGKYGQGILLPIEVNTRPNNLLITKVIASQELFEENEEEDEALSRPLKKKKTKHVTNQLRATLHFCKEKILAHPVEVKILSCFCIAFKVSYLLGISLVTCSVFFFLNGRLNASSSSSFSSDSGSCDAIALVVKRLLGRVFTSKGRSIPCPYFPNAPPSHLILSNNFDPMPNFFN